MSGDYFDLLDGCFVAHVPSHVHYLNKEDSMRLVSSVLPKQRIQARFISGLRLVSEETRND